MHERSLALALLRQVETHANAHRAFRVTEICVRIGALSGIEPLLLQQAFLQLAENGLAAGALVRLQEEELIARCHDCGHEFASENFRFICPACASGRTSPLQGESVILESITAACEDAEIA